MKRLSVPELLVQFAYQKQETALNALWGEVRQSDKENVLCEAISLLCFQMRLEEDLWFVRDTLRHHLRQQEIARRLDDPFCLLLGLGMESEVLMRILASRRRHTDLSWVDAIVHRLGSIRAIDMIVSRFDDDGLRRINMTPACLRLACGAKPEDLAPLKRLLRSPYIATDLNCQNTPAFEMPLVMWVSAGTMVYRCDDLHVWEGIQAMVDAGLDLSGLLYDGESAQSYCVTNFTSEMPDEKEERLINMIAPEQT